MGRIPFYLFSYWHKVSLPKSAGLGLNYMAVLNAIYRYTNLPA